MMYRSHLLSAIFCLCVLLWPDDLQAGAIESSYRNARDILDQALLFTGADQWQHSQQPLLIEASGTLYQGAEHQGYTANDPTPSEFHETWAYQPATGRIGREYRQKRPDGSDEWIREIFPSTGLQTLYFPDSGQSINLAGPSSDLSRRRNLRRFPPLLLNEALQNPEALRFIGNHGPFDGIQIQTGDNESLSLFFGRESHALGWVEYLRDLPTFSDSTVGWKFSDYRPVSGVGMVPHHYGVLINGKKFTSMKVTRVSTLESEVDAFLNLPTGSPEPRTIEIPANRDAAANATVESIADGVYRVKNLRTGFHMLFVEFESSLLAVDAPTGYPLLNELPAGDVAPGDSQSWLSQRYIQLMEETVPGKPVKHVVLTHFHNDHAGGLFAFADSKTHVLVEESEIPTIHEWLGGSHTLCGPQRPDGNLVIDAVKKRRVIKDASQHVEILDVGENPHSAHMLVIWLPKHKLLYVADLLTADDGRADQHHDRLNQHFLGWVERMRLEPDVILTAHGSGIVYTGEAMTSP